ncbi:MAG: hypothetical protein CMJ77_12495 [Planctomycetaceae bacterium]|nr:hypothetical protein [Planctomycetaceae bacterium]
MSTKKLVLLGLFLPIVYASISSAPAVAEEKEAPVSHVELIFDFGDGTEKHFKRLAWREKMTVFDAMRQAAAHPRGISFKHQGKRDTLFVTQIDDLKNEGGGKRNWIYRVNGELGDRSIGIKTLKVGDAILWSFKPYQ